jgi:hypothetical protein
MAMMTKMSAQTAAMTKSTWNGSKPHVKSAESTARYERTLVRAEVDVKAPQGWEMAVLKGNAQS